MFLNMSSSLFYMTVNEVGWLPWACRGINAVLLPKPLCNRPIIVDNLACLNDNIHHFLFCYSKGIEMGVQIQWSIT